MGIEIERKFLVADGSWRGGEAGVHYRQGYLAVGPPASVRVRVAGDRATLNIKNATLDIVRAEYEYAIPLEDAEALIDGLCDGRVVEKTRHKIPVAGHVWEVDEFCGANAGLVVAEIELQHEDEAFARPPWLAAEVSGDPRYLNSNLALHPFCEWKQIS